MGEGGFTFEILLKLKLVFMFSFTIQMVIYRSAWPQSTVCIAFVDILIANSSSPTTSTVASESIGLVDAIASVSTAVSCTLIHFTSRSAEPLNIVIKRGG